MLIKTNNLNTEQINELEKLKHACKKVDGSTPNVYSHLLVQPRNLPTISLYYEHNQLKAFLSVYFFYDDAVEITVMIHPSVRRQGLAKKLLEEALPLIQEQNYSKLIFSSPEHVNDHWLTDLGFSYLHSEYYMERNDLSPLLDYKKPLQFRFAGIQDISLLCMLDEACFSKTQSELMQRFHHVLNDRNYQIILAFKSNHFVGKAHLRWQKDGATLSDIAIIPHRQGKGLGTSLITHCINFALSEGKPHLNLDVETHNKKALNLYNRLGFLTQNACAYWSIEINQLQKQMQK